MQGNFDRTKGQLLLVASTLGEYKNKKCEGLPEMASAIKRIVAALPTRADALVVKQGSPGSSPADHGVSQYEKFSNDQLIAEAKVIAERLSNYQGEWKYQVEVEVGARYQNEREKSPTPKSGERIGQLWDEEEKARESVNQQYAMNSKVLFARADDLRGVCVDRLKKKGGQLPPDGKIDDVFKRLATAGLNGYGSNPDPDRASTYLLDLCKRLGP